ncbi:MAG: S9 family peptidase [Deltaproteobacteria bacterium]
MLRALVVVVAVAACGSSIVAPTAVKPAEADSPPTAERRPHQIASPNGDREDPYYWLRDDTRKDPAMLAYLAAENDYAATRFAPVAKLQDELLAEMRSHIKEDDTSVPVLDDGYLTYTKFAPGQEQPVVMRRHGNEAEQVMLDGNELARGHAFYLLASWHMSHDGHYVAWVDDIVGRRQFVLHIKDLTTGKVLADTAANVATTFQWANDNRTLLYTGKDAATLREDRVMRHVLGAPSDVEVYRETDPSYYVSTQATKSRRYIQIAMGATTNSEVRLVDADHPDAPVRVVLPRTKDVLYDLDHISNRFVIRTNADAKNFRVIQVEDGKERDRSQWHDVVAARPDQLVEDVVVSTHFLAATVRTGGLSKVLVLAAGAPFYIDMPETPSVAYAIDTPDPTATKLRFGYQSLVTPASTFELDVASRKKTLLKQQPVPKYDAALYATEYLHAPASDGSQIPISVVYRKTTKRDGSAPLYVYGYGSYGVSTEPTFSASRLSLLDRGWVVAIAHIRGGQEMGRGWYEDGKLMDKRNTFTDFIAATEYLVKAKYGARDQVFAHGGSAGGLLMGAILNMRPDLFRGVAAEVPFVDVVTTMLDESIPLTTNEFDEWGNPKQKAAYDYMLAYSPYDNVKAQAYPSIYVRTGLWDSQVQYYEPTKWVAKLRALKTDTNLIAMDVDMAAGHGGKSGRFDKLKDVARVYAFMLMVHDRHDARPHWP